MKSFKFALATGLFLLVVTAPVFAGDLILRTTGKWVGKGPENGRQPTQAQLDASNIKVLAENFDFVEYVYEGVKSRQREPAAKVAKVFYGSPPRGTIEAGAALNNGDYKLALSKYDTVARSRSTLQPHRMWALWNMGRIYQEALGDFDSAIQNWERLQKELPKAGVLPKALVMKGQAYLAKSDVQKAQQAFLSLQRLRGLPEGQKKSARYWVIYIKQHQGQAQQALNEYKTLLGEVKSDEALQEVAILARLGIGECMLGLKQYSQALDYFDQIAKSSNDSAVLAGAFNGLGRCSFEQGKWKDAMLSFLRVVILYNEKPNETARALYYAGRSYHMNKGHEWKDRSRSLLRECIAKYPGVWSKRSTDELQKIR